MTTYHITLSTGTKVDVYASSAADALSKALTRNPGKKITACHSGNKPDAGKYTGFIEYEIPDHDPYATDKADGESEQETEAFGFLASVPVRGKQPKQKGKAIKVNKQDAA